MKLIRSRGWRPDCNPGRRKAGRDAEHHAAGTERRVALRSLSTRLHPHTHTEDTTAGKRQCTSEQWAGEVAGSRLLATTRKQACCVRKRCSPAQQKETSQLIGSNVPRLIDGINKPHADQHEEVYVRCNQSPANV